MIPIGLDAVVREAAKNRCEACGFAEKRGMQGHCQWVLQLHHLLPAASGGSTCAENLALLCPTCHVLIQPFAEDAAKAFPKHGAERKYQLRYARRIRLAKKED